ncbi:MAG: hypothetical protein ACRD3S_18395, partial [Terracidiphilus sp.]
MTDSRDPQPTHREEIQFRTGVRPDPSEGREGAEPRALCIGIGADSDAEDVDLGGVGYAVTLELPH